MEEKKNPAVLIKAIGILPSIIQTIASVVKAKKDKKEAAKPEPETVAEGVVNSIKDAVSGEISSKRLLNIGGFGLIITIAVADISTYGITKQNLCLIGLGAAYSIAMSLITYLSERK